MKDIPWYIGQYDRRNYQSYFKVVAQETLDGWSVIDNPKKKFPRTGKSSSTELTFYNFARKNGLLFRWVQAFETRLRRNTSVVFILIMIYLPGSRCWRRVVD